jgi:hypothetical protein
LDRADTWLYLIEAMGELRGAIKLAPDVAHLPEPASNSVYTACITAA